MLLCWIGIQLSKLLLIKNMMAMLEVVSTHGLKLLANAALSDWNPAQQAIPGSESLVKHFAACTTFCVPERGT